MPAFRKAVALRHVAFEDLGLLAPILRQAGWTIEMRDAPTDDLGDPAIASADLLIVLGGPIGVGDIADYPFLGPEIALAERRLRDGRPILGICLGSQIMAKALGSRVYPGGAKEIGWGSLQLSEAGKASCLAPLAEPDAAVLHWHGDTFDLPHGATHLAASPLYPNQAFAYGRNALALQFHIEADPVRLEDWFVGHTVELAAARISVPDLRATTARVAPHVIPRATRIFARWLDEIA